jgi:hypothetical protein
MEKMNTQYLLFRTDPWNVIVIAGSSSSLITLCHSHERDWFASAYSGEVGRISGMTLGISNGQLLTLNEFCSRLRLHA